MGWVFALKSIGLVKSSGKAHCVSSNPRWIALRFVFVLAFTSPPPCCFEPALKNWDTTWLVEPALDRLALCFRLGFYISWLVQARLASLDMI